jgi:hypothetical protein
MDTVTELLDDECCDNLIVVNRTGTKDRCIKCGNIVKLHQYKRNKEWNIALAQSLLSTAIIAGLVALHWYTNYG